MPRKYRKLWVFGDSYSTPCFCVAPEDSFWGLLAKKLDIPTVINCSRPTNSFDTVCQLLVGMQKDYDWENDLFLVGLPHLSRITVFDDYKNTPYFGAEFDITSWQTTQIKIPAHHGLVCLQNFGEDKSLITLSDRSWLETQVLRTVFFLTKWLDSQSANYLILNLSKDLDKQNIWGPSEFVLEYALQHPRCILFENTYHSINLNKNLPADFDQYGWEGHHGPAGNRYFFENSLLPTMQRNKFC